MDNFLRSLLDKEIKIGKITVSVLDFLLLLGVTTMGGMMRYAVKDVVTTDWTVCLSIWISHMQEVGKFSVLSENFSNYTPPYLVLLYLIGKSGHNVFYMVKLVSCLFDFILSIMTALTVHHITKSKTKALGAYALVLILPTVVANGAMWAQCDVIYSTFVVTAVYFMLKEKPKTSMVFYGIAFAIKLQSMFIFPFFVLMWAKNKMKIQHFLFLPLMYLVGIFPGWIAGRPLKELLTIYVGQSNTEPWMLTWFWPNIYQLTTTTKFPLEYADAGLWFTLGILICVMFYIGKKKMMLDQNLMLKIAVLFALLVPFILPYMHERYGYVADILTVVYGLANLKKFYVPVIHVSLSYFAYTAYLAGTKQVPHPVYTFVLLAILVTVAVDVYQHIEKNRIDGIKV